ncbi:cytochrome P450 [uncultured Tateyamaria sp.]|uniref:cytochrome P450 n=1 Tax=uncultured Tateyamaria sp. TaxID=455651 RepID=UPI00262D553B|nr:cytochrome P450 [uncultured Tateyamaria sp.]
MSRNSPLALRLNTRAMVKTPHTLLDPMREYGDLVWLSNPNRWLVLSRSAALEVLRDPNLHVWTRRNSVERLQDRFDMDLSAVLKALDWIPFMHDGPRHAALRSAFARLLGSIGTDYLKAYEQTSSELLEVMQESGSGDFAAGYADRLHVEVFGHLAGVPPSERHAFHCATALDGTVQAASTVAKMQKACAQLDSVLERLQDLSKTETTSDFMDQVGAALIQSGLEDTAVSRSEFLLAFLLLGGDTQAGALTVGLAHLLDSNGGTLSLGSDDCQLPDKHCLVDEMIRISTPVQTSARYATKDTVISGQHIAKGDAVQLSLQAANFDPLAFECPHAVQSGRPKNVAFGGGRHLCSAMPLVRKTLAITLSHLETLGSIEALPGRTLAEDLTVRRFAHLPIRIPSRL